MRLVAVLVVLILSTLLARSESNPYSNIAARNVFALKPPPGPSPPPSPVAPPRPTPTLVLTGVADFSTAKWAFVTRTDSGQKPRNLTLSFGQTQGGLQLLALNARADTATLLEERRMGYCPHRITRGLFFDFTVSYRLPSKGRVRAC